MTLEIDVLTLFPSWFGWLVEERHVANALQGPLSLRLHNDHKAIVAAASKAWKRLCRETGRLTSLTSYPWSMKVKP